jgi:hypothetical protein
VQKIVHARKHVKMYTKDYVFIFLHFWFFTKIFMHSYIHMWKITTTMKIIIIWIINTFQLNLFHLNSIFRRLKKLNPWVFYPKNGSLILNMSKSITFNDKFSMKFNLYIKKTIKKNFPIKVFKKNLKTWNLY